MAIAVPLGAEMSRASVTDVGRLAVPARPADAGDVHLDARGVQRLGLVEEAQAGHRDPDRRILERSLEPREAPSAQRRCRD